MTYYVDALNSGLTWYFQNNITYSFDSEFLHAASNTQTSNYKFFNDAQQTAFRSATQHYENVANVNFNEVTGATSVWDFNLTLLAADIGGDIAGYAFYPDGAYGSDMIIDNSYNSYSGGDYFGLAPGSFGYSLMIHELGHAMGLDHPHEGVVMPIAEDSQNTTVMSYNDSDASKVGGIAATNAGPTAPQTLMIYDIAALQEMYGANHNYNSGNNTYSYNGSTYVGTIWDGAGSDTIDATTYGADSAIDLREGAAHVSTIGATKLWNAFGANIENVNSGAGSDVVYGNDINNHLRLGAGNDVSHGFAGDDILLGVDGNDWLQGNQGNDHLEGGNGNDTMYGGKDVDYVQGNAGLDNLNGNNGNDIVRGGRDNDTVRGGKGDDVVNGNIGEDIVYGNIGNDLIRGGQGNDTMYGNDGNDTILGNKGDDLLSGGAGFDVFVFTNENGADVIVDFEDVVDVIQIAASIIGTAANAVTFVTYNDAGALFDIGGGNNIQIDGMVSGSITESDFIII